MCVGCVLSNFVGELAVAMEMDGGPTEALFLLLLYPPILGGADTPQTCLPFELARCDDAGDSGAGGFLASG